MDNEVAVKGQTGLGQRIQYAQALAAADLLPKNYRAKPANILLAMEYGQALGLDTVTAIQSVHVIDGKPSASAQLIAALVRRAGHRLRVTGDDKHAVAEVIRKDDPDFVFRSEWTIARAQAAQLTGKGVWKQYPAAMLKARAITEVARDACPEALAGVAYTPEELGTDHYEESSGQAVIESPEPSGIDRKAAMKSIAHALTQCGVADPEQRRHIIELVITRDILSPDDMTDEETELVSVFLKDLADNEDPERALFDWLNAEEAELVE